MVVKKIFESNPPPMERTRKLLYKLEAGTLTTEEARKLKSILEAGLEKAKKRGDVPLVNFKVKKISQFSRKRIINR